MCYAPTASLFEVNSLAKETQIGVSTVKIYIQTLEKLFLLRTLPAWSTNRGKRLIKSPKIHMIDTGMICAICGLTTNDWLVQSDLFGHLIESYTVQQVMAQLSWRDDNIQCYHFRDQKKHQVDKVLQRGTSVWGIEMKRSSTISNDDYKGLNILSRTAGERWQGGVIFYSGEHILPTPIENTFAVPYSALWDGVS